MSVVNLETVNAIAQLLAAIGVIASLFYLAAQLRQNTRSRRAVVADSLALSLIDLLAPQACDVEWSNSLSVTSWPVGEEYPQIGSVAQGDGTIPDLRAVPGKATGQQVVAQCCHPERSAAKSKP